MNHIQLERSKISDSLALPDFLMDNAVDEEPNILPLHPITSPEDLGILQGQADESVTIQEALRYSCKSFGWKWSYLHCARSVLHGRAVRFNLGIIQSVQITPDLE
jgi:hypothetical protein